MTRSSDELKSAGAAEIYRGPGDLLAALGGSLLGTSHGRDDSDAAQLRQRNGLAVRLAGSRAR